MGKNPCCSKIGLHKGPWAPTEDKLLTNYIRSHGEGRWRSLPKKAGLLRCGKSCRLRWMNYLRPGIKRGDFSHGEDDIIMRMHSLLGNRWSLIAGRLPGRTDNEIKNYWNTHLSKKLKIIQDDNIDIRNLPLLVNLPANHNGSMHGKKDSENTVNPKVNKSYCKNIIDDGVCKPKPIRVTSPLTHFLVKDRDVKYSKSTNFDDSPVNISVDE
ncbi:hypothetical protein RD792_004464 [Penstemon davidsonii]|uniref:Uncharacterized protein n=1 Tax=Penstemon davidsonii TaxID=160366 RepID=A0ABR0DHG3_9LAMI|nr:hypothetical protein RD792_004464 [Penstemon davidsonii]